MLVDLCISVTLSSQTLPMCPRELNQNKSKHKQKPGNVIKDNWCKFSFFSSFFSDQLLNEALVGNKSVKRQPDFHQLSLIFPSPMAVLQDFLNGPVKDCVSQSYIDRFKTKHRFITKNANVSKLDSFIYTQYGPIKNSRIKNQPSDFGKK